MVTRRHPPKSGRHVSGHGMERRQLQAASRQARSLASTFGRPGTHVASPSVRGAGCAGRQRGAPRLGICLQARRGRRAAIEGIPAPRAFESRCLPTYVIKTQQVATHTSCGQHIGPLQLRQVPSRVCGASSFAACSFLSLKVRVIDMGESRAASVRPRLFAAPPGHLRQGRVNQAQALSWP